MIRAGRALGAAAWLVAAVGLAACDGDSGAAGGAGGSGGSAGGSGSGGSAGAPPVGSMDPALAAIQSQVDALKLDRNNPRWRSSLPAPTPVTFTAGKSYMWTLSTSKGEMRLKLRPDAAPMHVTSTIYLTLMGFYDTLSFHRIIKGFMAQGGDPLGNGTGTPGYAFGLEISADARHDGRGVLSMANSGPNSEGSQFFITFGAQPNLNDKYSAFGNLVTGDETLTAIEAVGTVGEGKPGPVSITSATISVE
jgi:peptidyl-prolyl cis-trans isomerase B (cyclophilin B)